MAVFFVVRKGFDIGVFRQSEVLVAEDNDFQFEVFAAGEELTEFVLFFGGKVGVEDDGDDGMTGRDFEVFEEFFAGDFFGLEEIFEM